MPKYYLAKTDAKTYSIKDFVKDKITKWDGVHNYQALSVIKSWKIGDLVLIYHSLGESKIVGIARVLTLPEKDKNDTRESWFSELELIREFPENQQVSLKEIKDTGLFKNFALVKQSRLSTMECPLEFIKWLEKEKVLSFSV